MASMMLMPWMLTICTFFMITHVQIVIIQAINIMHTSGVAAMISKV